MSPWERTKALMILLSTVITIMLAIMIVNKIKMRMAEYEYNNECYTNW